MNAMNRDCDNALSTAGLLGLAVGVVVCVLVRVPVAIAP